MSDQVQRDQKISKLADAMIDACSFADEASPLIFYSRSQAEIINNIMQQVVECSYFIKAYCRNNAFGELLGNSDAQGLSKLKILCPFRHTSDS